MSDPLWEKSVRSVVDSMVQPLVTDGWIVQVQTVDPTAKRVELHVDQNDCEVCVMSNEDLAGLLEEAITRTGHEAQVSVSGG